MILYVALGALLVAVATPPPAPKPTPTNPFNLDPIPVSTTLPVIGTTRAKPVCTAIRRAVAPAVAAALKNDQAYVGLRKKIFDYVVKDSNEARDLHLMQMDREVDGMVKNIDNLENALKSPALDIPATAKPEDAKTLRDLKAALNGVLGAQKFQLNAMSGFVETERMRRFGELSESEKNMQRSNNPQNLPNARDQAGNPIGQQTPIPLGAFLRDSEQMLNPQHRVANGLHDGHLLDRDLGDIAAITGKYEDNASKVIIPAAHACK